MNNTQETQGLSAGQILRVLYRHRLKFISTFVLVSAAVLVALLLAPRTYESETRLFVRVGRESVALDPTATTGHTMAVYDSRKSEIESVLDMLESRSLLESVIESVGADTISEEPVTTPRQHALLVKSVGESIKPDRNSNSNIIKVTCELRTPELAQQILTAYLAAFRAAYMRANRTAGSLEFFEEQTQLLDQRLIAAQVKLSEQRNSLNIGAIPKQRENLQLLLGEIETQLITAAANSAEANTRIETIRRLRDELPQRMLSTNVETNSAFDQARERLHELKIQEKELGQKFKDDHPRIKALKEQIAAAEKILNDYALAETSNETIGPVRQQLELDLLQQEAQAASIVSRISALDQQKSEILGRLRTLNQNEGPLQNLLDEVALLQTSHHAYAERLEQARINQDLSTALISNVNEIQPPSLVPDPVSPRRKIVMALGLIAAAICSCLVVLLCEVMAPSDSLSTHQQLTKTTLPQPSERRSRTESEAASEFVEHSFN